MDALAETLIEQNLDRCLAKLEALQDSQEILGSEMQRLRSITDLVNAATSPLEAGAEGRIKALEARFRASNEKLVALKSQIMIIQTRLNGHARG